MTQPSNIKALLAGARRREERVPICLRGDLHAQYERAKADLAAAKARASDSLASGAGAPEAAELVVDLAEQMRRWTVEFVIRALPPDRWTELLAQHPPRKDDMQDMIAGFNREAMSMAALREGVVEPELDGDDWATLLGGAVNRGQVVKLANAALSANEAAVDVPFSPAPSSTPTSTGAE